MSSLITSLIMGCPHVLHSLTHIGRGSEGDAENARHENAGLENAAQTCRLFAGGGKCETGKCDTKIQGWKMRECIMRHKAAKGGNAEMEKAGKEKYGKPYVK